MINFDVVLNGRGLEDVGLYGNSVDGIGLLTRGFVWGCASIWDVAPEDDHNTSWVECSTTGGNIETCDD